MKKKAILAALTAILALAQVAGAQSRHCATTAHPSYEGLVMAGYQGWFHNPGRGVMYPDAKDVRIDMWPDVSEYENTYPTGLEHADV